MRTRFIAKLVDANETRNFEGYNIALWRSRPCNLLQRLSSGIVHYMNNLHAGILGWASLLEFEGLDRAKIISTAKQISQTSKKAVDIIHAINDFGGVSIYYLSYFCIDDIIHEELENSKSKIDVKFALEINLAADITMYADMNNMKTIIQKLLDNAIDAMPSGGNLLISTELISVSSDRTSDYGLDAAGNYVKLSVKDSGVGIHKDLLPYIFEPFFTTKELSQGMGLGLAAVYGVVKQYHGSIIVDTEIGHGTTLEVYLPQIWRGKKIKKSAEEYI